MQPRLDVAGPQVPWKAPRHRAETFQLFGTKHRWTNLVKFGERGTCGQTSLFQALRCIGREWAGEGREDWGGSAGYGEKGRSPPPQTPRAPAPVSLCKIRKKITWTVTSSVYFHYFYYCTVIERFGYGRISKSRSDRVSERMRFMLSVIDFTNLHYNHCTCAAIFWSLYRRYRGLVPYILK